MKRAGIPYDAQLFGRMSIFGIVVGAGYGVLTGETAGIVLLVTFGIAAGIAGLAILIGSRRVAPAAGPDEAAAARPDREPVPRPGWAPIGLAIGLGGVAIGAAFGPWLIIAGGLFALGAAKAWLDAAMTETDDARGVQRRIAPDDGPASRVPELGARRAGGQEPRAIPPAPDTPPRRSPPTWCADAPDLRTPTAGLPGGDE